MFRKSSALLRITAMTVICILLCLLFAGCGAKIEQKTSGSYYQGENYIDLESAALDYADENDAKNFSYQRGWVNLSPSAQKITEYGMLTGYWKAVMISDPEDLKGGMFTDYFNVEISGAPDAVAVVFNWNRRVTEATGEVEDLKSARGGHEGSFSDGVITADSTNRLQLTDFRSFKGKEYAVGEYLWADGTQGYIGLIRP